MNYKWKYSLISRTFFSLISIAMTSQVFSQQLPDEVLDILDAKCAIPGCHAGSSPQKDLDLTEEFAFSSLANKPSKDYGSQYLLVEPQNPARSYLIMKLKGTGIKGEQMPKDGKPLSNAEVAAVESWINSLPANLKTEDPVKPVQAFPGISLATLPTTQIQDPGTFSYRIAHRWRGKVSDGFDQFFGLDGGARMLTQLSFPVVKNIMVTLSRTSENATFEFAGKWRFLQEKNDGSMPFSAALSAGVDWATREILTGVEEILDRTDSERFHLFGQLVLAKSLGQRISVLFVPGVLLNGNARVEDEAALITLGFAGKFLIYDGLSFFVEAVPIVSGSGDAEVVEGARFEGNEIVFNDAFTVGFEKRVGGHVFHVYVTNSIGLSTNQYMSGGNFDFSKGDFRLGFNIYRTLRLPF